MCTGQTLRSTLIFPEFTYLPSGRYRLNVALSKSELLESAVEILARGEPLTLDAVARASGLTKPGVIHHVGSKEGLMVAVVDHVIDRWTEDLDARLPSDATDVDRLAAYVDHALSTDFDPSDLAPSPTSGCARPFGIGGPRSCRPGSWPLPRGHSGRDEPLRVSSPTARGSTRRPASRS